ncbi:DUF1109 domain-containing protein [Novosphingobium sp. JCM 18896]|uniref:DUF1109 domain-containing protein n=1 Tax=Novosphingobium sp. JCM 18896 TaxID=2989731 RepID=UPI0022237E31|nr:DUF1109 domain-containing protein [Novosphingobium sp. JCM 18896]MCW1430124.1 DUF1109 domain-containing protein [Novosphingobium sp. JCM 18896]
MSHDALIAGLVTNLDPVRRRSVAREAALVLMLAAVELGLFLGLGAMRDDMGAMIGSPYMLWKLGGLALLALASGAVAIRSLSPTAQPRRDLAYVAVLVGLTIIAGALIDPMAGGDGQTILQRLSPANGLLCSLCIAVLALPMLAMLALLMRRGAPTRPRTSAWSIGLAAGTWGALVFAFCCPVNDPLYVATWYCVGCTMVAVMARWLLPKGFRL